MNRTLLIAQQASKGSMRIANAYSNLESDANKSRFDSECIAPHNFCSPISLQLQLEHVLSSARNHARQQLRRTAEACCKQVEHWRTDSSSRAHIVSNLYDMCAPSIV